MATIRKRGDFQWEVWVRRKVRHIMDCVKLLLHYTPLRIQDLQAFACISKCNTGECAGCQPRKFARYPDRSRKEAHMVRKGGKMG